MNLPMWNATSRGREKLNRQRQVSAIFRTRPEAGDPGTAPVTTARAHLDNRRSSKALTSYRPTANVCVHNPPSRTHRFVAKVKEKPIKLFPQKDMVIIKALIAIALAGAGSYVLTHVNQLSDDLQGLYVRHAEKVQAKKGFASYLFMYNPEIWKTPFARFLFKCLIIFSFSLDFGSFLVAIPIVFGPITL